MNLLKKGFSGDAQTLFVTLFQSEISYGDGHTVPSIRRIRAADCA
jgi:hypothetical protein